MNQILQLIKDNQHIKQPLNMVKNADEASLYIYDIIDPYWGVSAGNISKELDNLNGTNTLNVYINSPGGSVFEARAIMASLQRFNGKKIAHIDSLCASAATSIALACDEVQMTEGAMFMIHNASTLAYGDKDDMRETANVLEKVEGAIVNDYVSKTGKDEQEIKDMMNAETWFTAQEALDNGFIDSIKPSPSASKPKNAWNLSAYANAPKTEPEPEPPKDEPEQQEPAQEAGFFMSQSNKNKLTLLTAF
jgi:ATP-dependent protease ClpP protease subunit